MRPACTSQRAVAISPGGDQVALGRGDKVALWKLGKGAAGLSTQVVLEGVHKEAVKDIVYTGVTAEWLCQ